MLSPLVMSIALLLAEAHHPHWSYEGKDGPEHWGELDPSYAACAQGHQQSPIDIPLSTIQAEPLDPIQFHYRPSPLHVIDNGHTIMATYAPGSTIRVGSSEYELQQFHFHMPSEERFDGKSFPMVAHLVHKNKDGKLAVVAVLFQEGTVNPVLEGVFGHLPRQRDHEESPSGLVIDASALLPSKTSYVTFQGSLTTPPCSEGVTWYVLRTP